MDNTAEILVEKQQYLQHINIDHHEDLACVVETELPTPAIAEGPCKQNTFAHLLHMSQQSDCSSKLVK